MIQVGGRGVKEFKTNDAAKTLAGLLIHIKRKGYKVELNEDEIANEPNAMNWEDGYITCIELDFNQVRRSKGLQGFLMELEDKDTWTDPWFLHQTRSKSIARGGHHQ